MEEDRPIKPMAEEERPIKPMEQYPDMEYDDEEEREPPQVDFNAMLEKALEENPDASPPQDRARK